MSQRRRIVNLAVLLAVLSALTSVSGSDGQQSGKDTSTTDREDAYHRKFIDTWKYYAMDDPKRAAVLLLEEAREKGLDVNEIRDPDPRKGDLSLPFGYLEVKDGDRSFVDAVKARYGRGGGEADTMCLIQINRRMSIQERADFLMLGIRVYKSVAVYGFIARVPIDQVEAVSNLLFVRWIGAYKASYKYKQDFPYQNDKIFAIHAMIGDENEGRADLEKLGLKVADCGYGDYFVEMTKEDLPRVAQLWWVEEITQSRTPVFDTIYQRKSERVEKGPTSQYVDFRPQDSRKLVSSIPGYMSLGGSQVWDGGSEIIGILDNGCYWVHDELSPKRSLYCDASEDSLHGTMVAGIAAGAKKNLGDGDWAEGVASGAHFLFLKSDQDLNWCLTEFLKKSAWISNHSWGTRGPDSLNYTNNAKTCDKKADEADAVIVAAAGNNGGPVLSPGTGKNVITVGAVCYAGGGGFGIGEIAEYSSVGPTNDDSRLKPDLVAPGGHGGYYGVVSCKDPRSYILDWIPDPATSAYTYTRGQGTSYAAPHVTGVAAIIAEWYYETRATIDPQLPLLTAELLKAILINATIPLEGNGGPDSDETEAKLRAFANTTYGFGIANAYSAVNAYKRSFARPSAPLDDIERLAIFHSSVQKGLPWSEYINLTESVGQISPEYLVVTMVYDDVCGSAEIGDALWDKLILKIEDPIGTETTYTPPSNASNRGTIQKMMMPDPELGTWTVKVDFNESKDPDPPLQEFALVVDALYRKPELEVSVDVPNDPDDPIRVGKEFTLRVNVTNIGGNVAAGVTIKLHDMSGTFNIDGAAFSTQYYLDNLVRHGATTYKDFKLTPTLAGNYDLSVDYDGINKDLSWPDYPKTETFTINVLPVKTIGGGVETKSTWNGGNPVGISGVKMTGFPGGTVVTNANGHYSAVVASNWSGTIKPEKNGGLFFPDQITYGSSSGDKTDNYEMEVYTITGTITTDEEPPSPVSGITVKCHPAAPDTLKEANGITDENGMYTVYVERAWSGTIEPVGSQGYYTFTRTENTLEQYTDVVDNMPNQNFTATSIFEWPGGGVPVSCGFTWKNGVDLASDDAGGLIIVGSDAAPCTDIYAVKLNRGGDKTWCTSVQNLSCPPEYVDENPRMVSVGNGNATVAWIDERNGNKDVFAQKLLANGTVEWGMDGVSICDVSGEQSGARLIADGDGGAIIVWEDFRNGGYSDIYAQRIDSSGQILWNPNGVLVCGAVYSQSGPRLVSDGTGGAFITWEDYRLGTAQQSVDVYVQRVDSNGNVWSGFPDGVLVSDLLRNNGVRAYKCSPDIIADGNGCAIVVFEVQNVANAYTDIRVQKIDETGQLPWGTTGCIGLDAYEAPCPKFDAYFRNPSAVPDGSGGVIFACEHHKQIYPGDVFDQFTIVQRVNANGYPMWHSNWHNMGWDGVNVYYDFNEHPTTPERDGHTIVPDGRGGAIVAYRVGWPATHGQECLTLYTKIHVQHINESGKRTWGDYGEKLAECAYEHKNLSLTRDEGGGVFASWQERYNALYVARIDEGFTRFTISGHIQNGSGEAVKALVEAVEYGTGELSASTETDTTGFYSLTLTPFWNGTITPYPSGYLNQGDPSSYDIQNLSSDLTRDFSVTHLTTSWQEDGLAVCTAPNTQFAPVMSPDGSGGAYIAWVDRRLEYDQVYAHHVNSTGDLWGTINGKLMNDRGYGAGKPIITSAPSGSFIFWQQAPLGSTDWQVVGNRVNEYIEKMWGENLVMEYPTLASCRHMGVVSDGVGGFYFVWLCNNGCPGTMYVHRISSNGVRYWPVPIEIHDVLPVELPGVDIEVVSCSDGTGGILLCWLYSESLFSEFFLYVQRISPGGEKVWSSDNVQIAVDALGILVGCPFGMVPDGSGGAVVAWEDGSSPIVVKLHKITPDGTLCWGVAEGGIEVAKVLSSPTVSGGHSLEDITTDGAGGAIVAFGQDLDADLYAQRVDSTGALLWDSTGVAVCVGPESFSKASIVSDAAGGAVAVWADNSSGYWDAFATRVREDKTKPWGNKIIVSSNAVEEKPAAVISDGANGAIVAWVDDREGPPSYFDLYAVRIGEAAVGAQIGTFARSDSLERQLPDHVAIGCPAGDLDNIVVYIDFDNNDVLADLPAEAITISQPLAENVVFCGASSLTADSAAVAPDYKTTITIASYSGCGLDSATVMVYGSPVGYSRLNVKSPDLVLGYSLGKVRLEDFAVFGMHYPSTICDCINPYSYSECCNYIGDEEPDTTIDFYDFAYFGCHYDHAYTPGGQSAPPREIAYSDGRVELLFSEDGEPKGNRAMRAEVTVKNVEKYSAMLLSFQNENPDFKFSKWHQNPDYPYQTVCAEVVRNGQKEIMLGVMGGKDVVSVVRPGYLELEITSNEQMEISSEDFVLITADLLELDGKKRTFRDTQYQRSFKPVVFRNHLAQNYPNPFNPTTTIAYSIANDGDVELLIYNVRGALVKTLVKGYRKKDNYKVIWNGKNNSGNEVASGVYFYRLTAEDFRKTKKMVLLR